MLPFLIAVLLVLNLAAFFLMGTDKRRAVRGTWRISERTLLLACLPFSAAGGLVGMHVFRHKTRKLKFSLGVPAMLIAQAAVLIAVLPRIL